MRRFFPLVLMLLLVLRGLLGTAMAAGMVATPPAAGAVQQSHSVPQPLHPLHASENGATAEAAGPWATTEHHPFAHGDGNADGSHAQCSDPFASPCDSAAHTHGPLCSACEICHSVLFLPPPLSIPSHAGATEVRPAAAAPFASAAAALAIKPPIA